MQFLFFLLCYPLFSSPSAGSLDMIVEVYGIEEGNGAIHIGVYRPEDRFPVPNKTFAGAVEPVQNAETVHIALRALPPNEYAIAVFQDLNGNDKLDTNFFGIPTEPYGFSNQVRGKWRKPSFEGAAIQLKEDQQVVPVTLYRWSDR